MAMSCELYTYVQKSDLVYMLNLLGLGCTFYHGLHVVVIHDANYIDLSHYYFYTIMHTIDSQ
jgi:hypothetical protein